MITTFSNKHNGSIQLSKAYRKIRLNQPWRASAETHQLHAETHRPGFAARQQATDARSSGRKTTR